MLFTLDKEHKAKNPCEIAKAKHHMSQRKAHSPPKTEPQTTTFHPQATPSTPTEPNMSKSSTIANRDAAKMAAYAPVEIGTRGTVGSLIMKEIEHFSHLELSSRCSSHKPQPQFKGMVSSGSHLRPACESVVKTQKKKKRGTRILPSICSKVEVSDSNRPIGISVYSYRNLRSDVKKLPG